MKIKDGDYCWDLDRDISFHSEDYYLSGAEGWTWDYTESRRHCVVRVQVLDSELIKELLYVR